MRWPLLAAVAVMFAPDFFGRNGGELRAEYPILLLLSSVGMGMMVSASDLLTLYVGLELQSLAAYVLASFMRRDARSAEAGLKYFVLGALASGILLYGIALLYGFSGTTQFDGIATVMASGAQAPASSIARANFTAAAADLLPSVASSTGRGVATSGPGFRSRAEMGRTAGPVAERRLRLVCVDIVGLPVVTESVRRNRPGGARPAWRAALEARPRSGMDRLGWV